MGPVEDYRMTRDAYEKHPELEAAIKKLQDLQADKQRWFSFGEELKLKSLQEQLMDVEKLIAVNEEKQKAYLIKQQYGNI